MNNTSEIMQTFFEECDELLEGLDDDLMTIDSLAGEQAVDAEVINAIFRAVHSIKGGGAAFGLSRLVDFSHLFETTLDLLRSGSLDLTSDLMRVLHRAADVLNDLVSAAKAGQSEVVAVPQDLNDQLLDISKGCREPAESSPKISRRSEEVSQESSNSFEPLPISIGESPEGVGELVPFAETHIIFKPHGEMYGSGSDPLPILRRLVEKFDCSLRVKVGDIPDILQCEDDMAFLEWRLVAPPSVSREDIEQAFEFVLDSCKLEIRMFNPADNVLERDVTENQAPDSGRDSIIGPNVGIESGNGCVNPDEALGAVRPAESTATGNGASGSTTGSRATVRVGLELIDKLINMVGELVINQAVLSQSIEDAGVMDSEGVASCLAEFKSLARDIQESVMAIRAQSVKPLFQRMARIAREAAEISGKEVRFVVEGETTEIDKTIIERLVDPLTHMIRNSIDHGIENADERGERGKSEFGVVSISAAHRSGRVIIEVSDDGAGINREKVVEKAVAKGLIEAETNLKDSDIDNLLFLPGFSTVDTVSSLSGRGVGMDVVKSSIQKLGGRVSVSSSPGKGTAFSISLPLTLAVLDGMVVDVSGQTMVVPISAIVETLRPGERSQHRIGSSSNVVLVRGNMVPIVDLGVFFGYRKRPAVSSDVVYLLVESDVGGMKALAVDEIFDQRQVVIKGLEGNYGHVRGIAAATILGDGNIALIIDPEETSSVGSLGSCLSDQELCEGDE